MSSLVSWSHVHPVLVHFTTALFPVSFVSDAAGRYLKRSSLTDGAWWMLFFGALATPLTALAGWLWAAQNGAASGGDPMLATHRLLGLALVPAFAAMAIWRGRLFILSRTPGLVYLVVAALVIVGLLYQGYLGGKMTLG